jgi:hypothetical protein
MFTDPVRCDGLAAAIVLMVFDSEKDAKSKDDDHHYNHRAAVDQFKCRHGRNPL